ncbi:hypothetical protein HPB50_019865 [Hyalomma asiaticum]|uniref:Uncharacterized protein n=1 Tax=Hyalomma asiaticum TaxID=266040 RepID=A0ACB7T0R7_HYAAI|nr:hypothetical protein HPB50_019865 [Hyalomma asiaticum]
MSKAKKTADGAASSEEGLVDPLETLRAECREKDKCVALSQKLDECNGRVSSRSQTLETCAEELFEFLHCVDHCASKKVFKFLK